MFYNFQVKTVKQPNMVIKVSNVSDVTPSEDMIWPVFGCESQRNEMNEKSIN